MTLSDHDGALTGAGIVQPGVEFDGAESVTVTGAIADGRVSLQIDLGRDFEFPFVARRDGDRMTGSLIEPAGYITLVLDRD